MAQAEKGSPAFGEVFKNIAAIVLVLGAVALLGEGVEGLLKT